MPTVNHGNGFTLDDFSGGVIDDLCIADSLMPKNVVRKGINVMFNRPRGSVTQRKGTTQLGSTMSGTVRGLHNHRHSGGTNHQLLAAIGSEIKYLSGGTTWTTAVGGLTSDQKTRFLTYLDSTVFLNGSNQSQSWNGGVSWETSGGALDVDNFPITKFATVLNGRVFCAGNPTYPSRVYASSIVSTANEISWSSGNKNIDVFPNDGSGNIMGLSGNGKVILIFKERSLYRYDDNSLERIGFIGTTSHESIVTDDNGLVYFFGQGANGVGFYVTGGGFPKKISRPIQKWTEAISSSSYDDVAGYTDGNKIVWSVGSVTIGDNTYTNVCLVYNISDQTWEMRDYADRFGVFSQYINSSGSLYVVGGDTDGMVQTMDYGNTDNGTSIFSECEFGPVTFGDRGRTKIVDEIMTYATHFQGMRFHLKVDDGNYKELGSINAREQTFGAMHFSGHTYYPKITAVNSGTPFQFDGYNFVRWGDEGYNT